MIRFTLASDMEDFEIRLQEYHCRKEQYHALMTDFLYMSIGYGYQCHRLEASMQSFHDWQWQKCLARAKRVAGASR